MDTLLSTGLAALLTLFPLDPDLGAAAGEARQDLRVENLAALERAPARFLGHGRLAPNGTQLVTEGEVGAPTRS